MAEPHKNGNGRGANSRGRLSGRPRFKAAVDGQRNALSIRVTPELKRRLIAECGENGRSQNQEIEYRLERSFWLDDLLKARLISARVPAETGATLSFPTEGPNTVEVNTTCEIRPERPRAISKRFDALKTAVNSHLFMLGAAAVCSDGHTQERLLELKRELIAAMNEVPTSSAAEKEGVAESREWMGDPLKPARLGRKGNGNG